ncbi:hydroxyproline-rich glycoprotein family protein [Euphorbia peplus]|nr:hydroxyproline-rich glycoprotein family protein [Euphorbia peplus]
MVTHFTLIFSTLFLTFILLLLPQTIFSDDDTCPYPCYPPPTGTGSPTTPVPVNPTPPTGVSYSPPAGNYPSPAGNFPYNPSPPFSNNNGGGGPPPPEPILPYFPFYYRKPPHKPENDNSWATTLSVSTTLVMFFPFVFLFCNFLV